MLYQSHLSCNVWKAGGTEVQIKLLGKVSSPESRTFFIGSFCLFVCSQCGPSFAVSENPLKVLQLWGRGISWKLSFFLKSLELTYYPMNKTVFYLGANIYTITREKRINLTSAILYTEIFTCFGGGPSKTVNLFHITSVELGVLAKPNNPKANAPWFCLGLLAVRSTSCQISRFWDQVAEVWVVFRSGPSFS